MLVKTIKPHSNGYGNAFKKKKGQKYEHPNPAADLASGLVQEVEANDDSKDDRVPGNGKASVSTKKQHSNKHRQKNNEGGAGSDEDDSEKSGAKGDNA